MWRNPEDTDIFPKIVEQGDKWDEALQYLPSSILSGLHFVVENIPVYKFEDTDFRDRLAVINCELGRERPLLLLWEGPLRLIKMLERRNLG